MISKYLLLAGLVAGAQVSDVAQDSTTTPPAATAPADAGLPPDPKKMVDDALAKLDEGEYQAAADLVNKAARLNPKIDKIKLVTGLIQAISNKGPEAVSDLAAYCRTDEGKKDYRGYDALGQVYFKSRNYRQAMENFERAVPFAPAEERGEPVRARIMMDLAYIEIMLQHAKEAMELATKARDASPRNSFILQRFAQIAYMAGPQYHADAVTAAQQGIGLLETQELPADPFDKNKLSRLKTCYSVITQVFDVQRKANPKNAAAYFNVARATREITRVDRQLALQSAREWAMEALNNDPNNVEYVLFLAELEVEMGALREAGDRIDALLAKDPSNQRASQLRLLITQQRSARPPAAPAAP